MLVMKLPKCPYVQLCSNYLVCRTNVIRHGKNEYSSTRHSNGCLSCLCNSARLFWKIGMSGRNCSTSLHATLLLFFFLQELTLCSNYQYELTALVKVSISFGTKFIHHDCMFFGTEGWKWWHIFKVKLFKNSLDDIK